ncbi:MAG: hypothetical protein KJ069_31225 [Anaerolineae bacterium]|nr:hypothetical protein [Anaerolineae bacterium]
MIDLVVPLVVSIIAFSIGCFMAYRLYKDRQGWDEFWESQNRQRPLAPKTWAGSDISKLFSYLFAALLLLGGFIAMVSSSMNLLFSLWAGN